MSWLTDKLEELQSVFGSYAPKTTVTATVDYNSLKVTDLKAMAKEKGLKGYTTLRKAQLIEMLQQN